MLDLNIVWYNDMLDHKLLNLNLNSSDYRDSRALANAILQQNQEKIATEIKGFGYFLSTDLH